MFKLLKRM